MKPNCHGCIYAVPTISDRPEEGPIMFCHRYPPTVLLDGYGDPVQIYPQASDGCGEYRSEGDE